MAAGHVISGTRSSTSSSYTSLSCSLFPSSTTSSGKIVTRVKLPVVQKPCAALVVSPKIEEEISVVSVPRIEAPLAWSFQDLAFRAEDGVEDMVDTFRPKLKDKSKKKVWEVLNDGAGGNQTDSSARLPWMDPSLRYANVMWFKGAFNAQIFVSPDESEDSIIRRFRHAVAGAGVIRECYRRRYRETPQDVVKRKQRQAALYRKKRRQYEGSSAYAYKFPSENSGHNKKTTKKKEARTRPGWDAGKKGFTEKKKYDSDDDDFWGYAEDDDRRW